MKMIPNASKVTTGAWSMRLWFLAGLLQAVGLAWPQVQGDVQALVSPFTFHVLGILAGLAGQVARVFYQQSLHEGE